MNPASNSKEDVGPVVCNEYLRKLMNPYCSQARNLENQNNLDMISKHIKKFRFWEKLPTELKCMIIKEVDFITRFSLLSCSKSMQKIAESVPFSIKSIDVKPYVDPYDDDDRGQEVFRLVPQPGLQKNEVLVAFQGLPGGVCIYRKWWKERLDRKKDRYIETRQRYLYFKYNIEAFSFAEEMLELAKYRIDELTVHITDWCYDKPDDFAIFEKLKVRKKLMVDVSDEDILKKWLDTAILPLEDLEIEFYNREDKKCTIEHEAIDNAKKLNLSGFAIDDSRLLSFKCGDVTILESSGITERGINTYLKRWVDGGGPENFTQACFPGNRTDQVLNNLDYFEWDDEFRRENKTLCDWIDKEHRNQDKKCYYIESAKRNNGATLIMTDYSLGFLVTGKREMIYG